MRSRQSNTTTSLDKTFDEIYKKYGEKIFNLAYRMTGDISTAEDITQETFVRVYNKRSTFRGESEIFTWIYAIAKNICFQHFKDLKRSSFQNIEDLIGRAGDSKKDSVFDEHERNSYVSQVKEGCLLGLLRCLPFHQRTVFILHVLNDVPVKDTAAIIRKSENSARILLHRARTSLKKFLCANCSLYDEKNSCRCENLVAFSLKQGWIKKGPIDVLKIENELHELKNEISLYRSIGEREVPIRLSSLIKKGKHVIFSGKKVK